MVQEKSFKDISYLELAVTLFGEAEPLKILCNFDRKHNEEQLCEFILNLNQWFKRCHLKIVLI